MNFKFCPNCGREATVQKQNETDYECSNCGWHFWNNAKTAVAVAFIKDGQLLVNKRGRKTDPSYEKYDLVGGFVDFGENAYDAAIREVREEAGVSLTRKDLQLMDVYSNHYIDGISTIDIAFLVRDWRWGTPMAQPGEDAGSLEWKPLSFIYDKDFWQDYSGLDKIITRHLGKA